MHAYIPNISSVCLKIYTATSKIQSLKDEVKINGKDKGQLLTHLNHIHLTLEKIHFEALEEEMAYDSS